MDARALRVVTRVLDEAAAVLEPAVVGALRAGLAGQDDGLVTFEELPHRSVVVFTTLGGRRRRVLEADRHGTLLTTLRWTVSGLARAAARIPDGRWIILEAGSGATAAPGGIDRLRLGAHPAATEASVLGEFSALDYTALDDIPTLPDPTRLPPGAGTAILNLLAALAADGARRRLRYRGPFPSEQLFLALLESFRYVEAADAGPNPLITFDRGALEWEPVPHERLVERDGVVVQLRGRIEKVSWRGRTYYRPDWQSIRRHAPRRVRDTGDEVVCSLWAFGAPIEDHVRLAGDGALLELVPRPAADVPMHAFADVVVRGIVESVAATSAPALASDIRAAGEALHLGWGPVDDDLVRVEGTTVTVSTKLREAAVTRLRAGADRAAVVRLGFAVVAEIAALVGDTLRMRAQSALARRPAAAQEAALGALDDPARAESAAVISHAVEVVLADLGPA